MFLRQNDGFDQRLFGLPQTNDVLKGGGGGRGGGGGKSGEGSAGGKSGEGSVGRYSHK